MCARHRAFALIIVLIAIAAVFALSLRAAVIARSGIIESGATRDRISLERTAAVAAILALDAYLPITQDQDSLQNDADASSRPTPGAGEPEKKVELPDFLLEMVPELAKVQQEARDEVPRDPGNLETFPTEPATTSPRANTLARIRQVGLPQEPLRLQLHAREAEVVYDDLSGLLDLNTADDQTIERLMVEVGIEPDPARRLASQIIDWRDPDSFRLPGGAERDDYRPFGVVPRNAPFAAPEELLYLPDMTPQRFEAIAPYIMFSGGPNEKLSINAAPRPVLVAILGISPDKADAIIASRASAPLTESQVQDLLPANLRDDADRFTHRLSGRLRAHIRILDPSSKSLQARFTAVVFASERGLSLAAIRPE